MGGGGGRIAGRTGAASPKGRGRGCGRAVGWAVRKTAGGGMTRGLGEAGGVADPRPALCLARRRQAVQMPSMMEIASSDSSRAPHRSHCRGLFIQSKFILVWTFGAVISRRRLHAADGRANRPRVRAGARSAHRYDHRPLESHNCSRPLLLTAGPGRSWHPRRPIRPRTLKSLRPAAQPLSRVGSHPRGLSVRSAGRQSPGLFMAGTCRLRPAGRRFGVVPLRPEPAQGDAVPIG
jgi:hypothetical protein